MKRRRRQFRRRGYLLLTVVVLIAVASLMLSKMATDSMRVASVAVNEERELRNRWAKTSLRRFCLDAAAELVSDDDLRTGDTQGAPVVWKDIRLAGHTWRVIVADESAKLNLNQVESRYGREKASESMESLLSGSGTALSGARSGDVSGRRKTRWEHWLDQGPGGRGRGDLAVDPRKLARATQRMTLWGDGRLNVYACDEQTMEWVWRLLFQRPIPSEFWEARSEDPQPEYSQLLAMLDLRESQAKIASRWLTTNSSTYSVWVFCQSDHRVSPSLFVEWGHSPGSDRSRSNRSTVQFRGYEY